MRADGRRACMASGLRGCPGPSTWYRSNFAGHGRRMGEPFDECLESAAADLLRGVREVARSQPYALFGHSMGGTLGLRDRQGAGARRAAVAEGVVRVGLPSRRMPPPGTRACTCSRTRTCCMRSTGSAYAEGVPRDAGTGRDVSADPAQRLPSDRTLPIPRAGARDEHRAGAAARRPRSAGRQTRDLRVAALHALRPAGARIRRRPFLRQQAHRRDLSAGADTLEAA